MIELGTIIAAAGRGWSPKMIATAAGVSHQAVDQRLAKAGVTTAPAGRPKGRRVSFICAHCGLASWIKPSDARHHRKQKHFCSWTCAGKASRQIPDEIIDRAIELRRNGNSWAHVQKLLKVASQVLQRRIWMRLNEKGLLTRKVVYGLWYPPCAKYRERQTSWAWLERKTGLRPS